MRFSKNSQKKRKKFSYIAQVIRWTNKQQQISNITCMWRMLFLKILREKKIDRYTQHTHTNIYHKLIYRFYLLPLQDRKKTIINVFIFTRGFDPLKLAKTTRQCIYIQWIKICVFFFEAKQKYIKRYLNNEKVANKLWSCLQVPLHFLILMYCDSSCVHRKQIKCFFHKQTHTHTHTYVHHKVYAHSFIFFIIGAVFVCGVIVRAWSKNAIEDNELKKNKHKYPTNNVYTQRLMAVFLS